MNLPDNLDYESASALLKDSGFSGSFLNAVLRSKDCCEKEAHVLTEIVPIWGSGSSYPT